ncbi:MAG: acetate--CoA ligase family protein [Actinomycetota bacterium]
MATRSLRPLLAPRTIAVIGASEARDSWAPEIHASLRDFGFRGRIFPVNPKYREVWGLPSVPTAAELPRGVDLAVVVVPARVAVRVTEEAARAGVRSAMIVSSGFSEAGPEGEALQRELTEVAARHRLPVLGPNVEGYLNYVDRVAPYGTVLPPDPRAGGLTVISQSGTVVWSMVQMASDRGVGVRAAIGLGNEAVLGLGDLVGWAAADRPTRVVACYAEAFRDVRSLERGLAAARKARKPVLICAPAGRSEAARRSVLAHTGALAGETGVRDAWLRRAGALVVRDPLELFEASVLLLARRRTRSRGVAAAMQSGGACTLFAEAAEVAGLELPAPLAATQERLRGLLPGFANPTNPLDVTGQAVFEPDMFRAALSAVVEDERVGVVVVDAAPPRRDGDLNWSEPVLEHARNLQGDSGVAFVSVLMSPLAYSKTAVAFVDRAGIPFLQGHRPAAAAIRALLDWQERRPRGSTRAHHGRSRAMRLVRGRTGPLNEVEAGRLLEAYGIPRPPERVVTSPEQAAKAAEALGSPVAVKAVAGSLTHKARVGAVRLVVNADDVRDAADQVLAAARSAGVRSPGLLVQRMVAGPEVLIGAVVDERFGPAVTLRPGGAAAEAGEATFLSAPLTRRQAEALVRAEAPRCGLDPARDDFGAVARAVVAMARLAYDLRDRLTEVEANPFVLTPRGGVAVDALAVCRGKVSARGGG